LRIKVSLLSTANLIVDSLRVDKPVFKIGLGIDWPQLVHHADGHSLTPLLYDTWRQAGLLESLPAGICDRMAQAYADNALRNGYIRAEVLQINQMLAEAGVQHLVLKGWPLVEQLYSKPAQRVLYDHDFLVRKAQAHQAYHTKDEWVEKHLPPLWRNNGYCWDGYLFDPLYPRPVELHLRLWEDGWRGLRVRQLADPWADSPTCHVGKARVRTLSPEKTLIHLTMHFAGHLIERDARLNQLLDLARFQQRQSANLDWSLIVRQAAQANLSRFVYAGLLLAHDIFGAPLPPESAWRLLSAKTPAGFRHWLAEQGPADVLTSDYRQIAKGKDYQLTFLAANSLGERLGVVRFAMLPPVGQLMAKYHFRRRWLGPLFYPRYLFDRLRSYAGAIRGKVDRVG
jgi:hypothetical protein